MDGPAIPASEIVAVNSGVFLSAPATPAEPSNTTRSLTGSIFAFAVLSALLSQPVSLAGSVAGAANLAGAVTSSKLLAGGIAGSGNVTAALTFTRLFAGAVSGAGVATGALNVSGTSALVGALNGAGSAVGSLTVVSNVALSGVILGVGVATGAITNSPTQALRIAATLGRVSGANSDGGNDGTNTQSVSRTVHRTGKYPVTGLRLIAANVKILASTPFGEAGVGNAITYQTAIEFGGVNTYALWAGVAAKSVADKSIAASDAIMDLAAGQLFYTRNYLTVASAANKWPRAQNITQGSQYAKKGTALASTFTATGVISGTPQDAANPPIAFIGMVDRASVAVVYTGDSIADNTGDLTTIDPDGTVGFVGRGLVGVNGFNLPHAKLSRAGDTLLGLADPTSGAVRRSLFQYATHYIDELGSNDIVQDRTLSQIQADCLTVWAAARAAGVQKIYRCTIIPRTTSTDAWATTANQTPYTGFAVGGVRDQLNAWFLTKVTDGTIDGVIDVNADCRDATATDKWRVDLGAGNNTADGSHPQSGLHTIMAARVNASATTWTAA